METGMWSPKNFARRYKQCAIQTNGGGEEHLIILIVAVSSSCQKQNKGLATPKKAIGRNKQEAKTGYCDAKARHRNAQTNTVSGLLNRDTCLFLHLQ